MILAAPCAIGRKLTSRLVRLAGFAAGAVASAYLFKIAGVVAEAALSGGLPETAALPTNPLPSSGTTFLAMLGGMIFLEVVLLGWRESSLRQLATQEDASAATDVLYLMLWLSGVMDVLAAAMTLGLASVIAAQVERLGGLGVFLDAPLWLGLPGALLAMSFTQYGKHRAVHSRWFWPLHKSHHAPTRFTVANAFRSHPIDLGLGVAANGLVLGLLGFAPEAIVIGRLCLGVMAVFLHSNIRSLGWLETIGLCTPNGHLIHHSTDPRHYNRNLGTMFNVWDRLFGTYAPPPAGVAAFAIGVDDSASVHNTERPIRAIRVQTLLWLDELRREVRSAMMRPARSPR
jgi:sterol desaturase/sphingolipid hydroxylase (fatty acid hydroxylase superfamily)